MFHWQQQRPGQWVLAEMPWSKETGRADSPCSGRTDSICDSETRPLEVGLGCSWKLLPLCRHTRVSGTTNARRADLLRRVDRQDMSRQVGLACGACSASLRGWHFVLVCCITQNAVRRERTISASGCTSGIDLHRVVLRRVGSKDANRWHKRCCMQTSPPVNILYLGKTWELVVTDAVPARDAFFQPRSLLRGLVTAEERLAGFAISVGAREQPVATTSGLAHRNEAEFERRDRDPATVRFSEFFWFFASIGCRVLAVIR